MRSLHAVTMTFLVVASTVSVTFAQFGLCGAPDLVRIPKPQQKLLPQYTYGNQHGYANQQAIPVQPQYQPVPVGYQQPVAYQQQPVAYQQQPVVYQQQPIVYQQAAPTYVMPNGVYAAPANTGLVQPAPAAPRPKGQKAPAKKAAPSSPNTVSKMLRENSGVAPIASGQATSEGLFMGRGSCADDCYTGQDGSYPSMGQGYCCPWYASITGLMMGRNQANGIWTTYETADATNQMMKSNFDVEWKGGAEIRFGRRFCCDTWALEFVYWTLDPFQGMQTASVPGGTVSSTLEVAEVEFVGNGVTRNAAAIFNNSSEQRLWRSDEIHNFELNLLRGNFNRCNEICWPWDTQWSMGFRYLRFRDRLIYGGVMQNNTWGDVGGINEAYLNDHVKNNIYAFQFGLETRAPRWNNFQLFLSPKIAIGCNHIENEYQLLRGDGVVGQPTVASGVVGSFPVTSSKDVFSLITQIDIGVEWNFTCNWSARLGYRLMMATGMGLADNQIPFYIVDIPEIQDIDHNAELILHGGFAGITYNF